MEAKITIQDTESSADSLRVYFEPTHNHSIGMFYFTPVIGKMEQEEIRVTKSQAKELIEYLQQFL